MRRTPAIVVLSVLAVLTLAPPAAADSLQECVDSRPADVPIMEWTCVSEGGETFVGTDTGGGHGSSALGAFVVFALVWSVVPFAIAWFMASSRGESVGTAILLTLILGWVGLGIVWYGQQRTRSVVEGRSVSSSSSIADRLRTIDDLHRDGTLSDDEHRQQRARIVGDV